MKEYKENPAILESRTPQDILNTFTTTEKKAFYSMNKDEISYLMNDCSISTYIEYLRKGANNCAIGADHPVLVVKGSKLQLERFKLVFLLSLIDYKGLMYLQPIDFELGKSTYEEAQDFTGVVIIRIPFGSATTSGFDKFRSELITNVLSTRRDKFNPTIVLTEESIAGKLNQSYDLIKVIELDSYRLRASYDGSIIKIDKSIASRDKNEPTNNIKPEFNQFFKNNTYKKHNTTERFNVNRFRELREE